MKKNWRILTAGILAGSILFGGAVVSGQVEAASAISAKYGSTVDVKNENQVIDNIISTGKALIGKAKYSHSYQAGKYMDCSGFTYYIFSKNGIDIHTRDDDKQVKLGSYVPKSQLQKGDLIFYSTKADKSDITHVSMYIGDGKVLHMANSTSNVTISSLDSSWHKKYYVTARRVIK